MQHRPFISTTLCFVFAGFTVAQKAKGQSAHASNVFLELGGNAGIISLNYDRRFGAGDNGFGGRIGIGCGVVPNHMFGDAVLTVPVAVNYLAGEGPHYLEAGAGFTFGESAFGGKYRTDGKAVHFVPSLGYRYQRATGGFTFRAMASPHILGTVRPSGGISVGYHF